MSSSLARFGRLSSGLALDALYLAASLVPRDKDAWVFGAWNGRRYEDNSRYLYEYTRDLDGPVEATWITKDIGLARALRSRGIAANYYLSARGLWRQLRAGVVVVSHSVEWDLWAPLIARRVTRVQAWHGIPVKRIGYDDERGTSADRARVISRAYPYRRDHFDLVLAAGPSDQARFRSAFNVDPENVVVTGYPRNDALVRPGRPTAHAPTRIRALYMPTLRGSAGSHFPLFTDTEFASMDEQCLSAGVELFIRIHPAQRLQEGDRAAIDQCRQIHILDLPQLADIHDHLSEFDVLITDYSSIYLDFMITKKPVIMAPFGLADFLAEDRGLYYEYSAVCPSPPRSSWAQVLAELGTISAGQYRIQDRYLELLDAFQTFRDSRSAERAYYAILDSRSAKAR